jgi:hypothetical protein
MKPIHKIGKIKFFDSYMEIAIDGENYKIDLKKESKKLFNADLKTKQNYQISPSGYGIHWPDIDEDLSIDGMIGISHIKPDIKLLRKAS